MKVRCQFPTKELEAILKAVASQQLGTDVVAVEAITCFDLNGQEVETAFIEITIQTWKQKIHEC